LILISYIRLEEEEEEKNFLFYLNYFLFVVFLQKFPKIKTCTFSYTVFIFPFMGASIVEN
jgi:hypothetical protein